MFRAEAALRPIVDMVVDVSALGPDEVTTVRPQRAQCRQSEEIPGSLQNWTLRCHSDLGRSLVDRRESWV